MPTVGSYEFKLSENAVDGVIKDENQIGRGCWAWIDRTQEWAAVGVDPAGSRRWLMIYARCPDCGNLSTLWRLQSPPGHSHEVDATGLLKPSVQCAHESCGFHTSPTRLLGFVDRRKSS